MLTCRGFKMSNKDKVIQQAQEVLRLEARAIERSASLLNATFANAVELILSIKGRVIVTGMGKPGYIAQKIAATLMSTGTPAYYLHPAEGIHGDLGMITQHDIVIALSNSGETAEIVNILPTISRIGAPIIAICGNKVSTLAKHAVLTLDASVEQEVCPLGLAPTTSTTVELAIGDALAIALMKARKFSASDFAIYHPGGSLGKRLLLTVANVMHDGESNPIVNADQTVSQALFTITERGIGATSVINNQGQLLGIITDGDIRRALEKGYDFLDKKVTEIMTKQPMTITADKLASEALFVMEQHKPKPITVLPVINDQKHAIGMLHLTDLLRHGIM